MIKYFNIQTTVIGLWIFSLISQAQELKYFKPEIEIYTAISGGKGNFLPYWFSANKYGIWDFYNNQAITGIRIEKSIEKTYDYSYGIETYIQYSNNRLKTKIIQAYAGGKVFFTDFYFGKRKRIYGNADTLLTSGNILFSGNAEPVPEIYAGIINYYDIPFTNRWIAIKGGISHGWLYDNEFYKNAWLHHKYFFIKVGGNFCINIEYGLHHAVQWGGFLINPALGKLPSSLHDYWRVFRAKGASTDAPESEVINALGNHIGSRNYALIIKPNNMLLKFYHQDIFEDNSGRRFRNWPDGLFGLTITFKNYSVLHKIVYEYFQSTNQSGNYHSYWIRNDSIFYDYVPGSTEYIIGGNDNYFNNGIYRTGWTSKYRTIGTPFITSPFYTYQKYGKLPLIANNKVRAHFFGILGNIKKISYTLMYSYSMNYGINRREFNPFLHQKSVLLSLSFTDVVLKNSNIQIHFSFDIGKITGNNYSLGVEWSKTIF